MHHNAMRRRVWDSGAGRHWVGVPILDVGPRPSYPLKPPHAGAARPHPIKGGRQQDLF